MNAPTVRRVSAVVRPRFDGRYQDPAIERSVVKPGQRVLVVGAGRVALALSREGAAVVVVDPSAARIDRMQRRLAGASVTSDATGRLEARLERLRSWLWRVGPDRETWRTFMDLTSPAEQGIFWRRRLAEAWPRRELSAALARLGAELDLDLPGGPELTRRLERCWAIHPNRFNPVLRELLLGETPPAELLAGPPAREPRFENAQPLNYLENAAPASFDGLALGVAMERGDRARWLSVIRQVAASEAWIVTRSLAVPDDPAAAQMAAVDRSAIWGGILVETVSALDRLERLGPSPMAAARESLRPARGSVAAVAAT